MLASERETIEKVVKTVLCLVKHYLIYFKRNVTKNSQSIKKPNEIFNYTLNKNKTTLLT